MTALLAAANDLIVLAQDLNPPPQAPPGLAPFATDLIAWMKWGGLATGVAGLIICGIMMNIGRRNRSALAADGVAGIPWTIGGLTLIALSAGIAGTVLG